MANANIHAGSGVVMGVAIREFPFNSGYGFADYLIYIDGKAAGVIETKKESIVLNGI
jgi:type I restriction enzyme, R subunit